MPSVDEFLDAPPKPDRLDAFLDEPAPVAKPDALDAFLDEPAPATEPEATPVAKSSLLRRALGDPALSLAKGVVGVPAAVTGLLDIPTGGGAGKFLQDTTGYSPKVTTDFLDEFLSPEQKLANAEVEKAKGFVGTAKAMLQNPSTIGHTLLESAPSMVAGGVAAKVAGKIPAIAKLGQKAMPFLVGGGEGATSAGQTATSFREQSKSGLLTPEQAALALSSGTFTALIGVVGGKVAQKLGITDIDLLVAGAKTKAAKESLAKRVAEGFITEGGEELSQSAVEQIHNNIANGKPWMEGVPEAMAQGVVTGGVMGGAVNLRSAGGAPDSAPIPPVIPAAPPVATPAQVPLTYKTEVGKDGIQPGLATSIPDELKAGTPVPVVEAPKPAEMAKPIVPEVGKFIADFYDPTKKISNASDNPEVTTTEKTGMALKGVPDLDALLEMDIKNKAELSKFKERMAAGEKLSPEEQARYMQIGMRVQFPREVIETATNSGSWSEANGTRVGKKLPNRPLDWNKNPEVAAWLKKNAETIGIKLEDVPVESFEDFKKREDARKAALASEKPQGAGEPPADVNIPPVVGAQPAVPVSQVMELAKANPDGVDVTHLSKKDRRALRLQGVELRQNKAGRVIATYPQKVSKVAAVKPPQPKRMAEIAEPDKLVWYRTHPKYLPTLTKRLARNGLTEKYVLDSISEDGRIAFTEGIDPKTAELMRLKAEPIPKVKGENLFSIRKQFTDLMQEFGERMGHIRDMNRYSAGLVSETGVNQGSIGIRGRIENSRAVKAAHESIFKSLGLDPADKSLQAFAKALPLLKAEVAKFKVMDENFLTRDDFTKTRITADDLQPGDTITSNGVTLKVERRNSDGTVRVSSTETGDQFFSKGQEIWVDDAELQTKPSFSPELVDEAAPDEQAEEPPAEGQQPKSMGGAIFGEFEGGEGDYVSNMFAAIDRDRQQMGKPPMPEGNPRTWDEDNQRALAKMNREPDWIPRLIQSVLANPRPLLSWENAGVVWYRARLRAEANNALGRVNRAFEDDNAEGLLEAKLDAQRFEDELMQLDEAVGRGGTGSEAGRSLQAQKMAAGDDFTLVEMRLQRRARENDGAPLTEKQEAEVKALHDELKATRDAFDQYIKDAEAKEAGRLAKEALEQIEREKNKPKASDYVISVAEKWVKEWDKSAEAAKERLRKKGINVQMSLTVIDPTILADYVLIGRAAIGRLGLDVAKFTKEMVATFGDAIKPHIQQIYDASVAAIEKVNMPVEVKKKILTKVKDMTPEQRKTRLVEKIQDKFDQGKRNEITGIVQKLAREVVEDGARGWEAILDGVHAIIQGIDPEFTRRETMDAISGYGKYKRLSMDEISVALREGKGEMQQVAKIEDITSGVPPKPTGIERRSPSESEREKIKLVNELKKKHPELFEGSGLKSSLESRKTYYRNRISDLRSEIAAREKLIKEKTIPPTDPELEALKAEAKSVKAEWDAIFKKGLTDAQRIELVKKSIERQIAELARRIGAKDFSKKKPAWFSKAPELDALKAERDALRAEFDALRDADPEWQSEQAVKKLEQDKATLERTIAEQERKLRENDLATKKQPVNRPAVDGLEQLKQTRDRLAKQIADRRKKSPADKWAAAQAKRLEQMNQSIAEKEAKLASGDLSTAPRMVNLPLREDLEIARQRLVELNRQLADARKPKRSQAEKDLQQFIARRTRQISEWERRIREGDFEKKPRKEILMTPEASELQGQAEAAKNKYLKARWEWAQAKRSTGRKILDGIQKARGATVNIASSFDFSAGRQALLAILSNITRLATNPIQGTRMIVRPTVDMFKAWASDVKARGIEQRIKNRPNSLSGADKIAGIEYSALDSNNFTKYEENAHSILDEWAELPLRTGNTAKTAATLLPKLGARGVRMSNRAFITFLNQTRADLFDELLRVNFKDRPPTEAELKLIGNYVNIATGRGKMKPKTAQVASEVLWAPKLLASRVQFLTGQPLWTGQWADSARGRKIVAQEYARIIMGGFLLATVARMFDDKKEEDPTSSDFGKVVRGKTRIDLWGGLQQVTTLGARTITASTKTLKGDVRSIGADKKYGQKQPWYVWADFIRSKLRPDVATAVDIGNRTLFGGEKTTPQAVAKNLLVPLPLREITTIMKENGFTEGMIIQALGQFGAGVSVYENKESQR